MENSWAVPQKAKCRVVIWSSNSTPSYIPKRIESKDLNRYLYVNACPTVIHSSKTCWYRVFIGRWIDKKRDIYTMGILFSHKKEWSSDSCWNMDEPWKYFTDRNKPDTKEQMVYGSTLWISRNSKFIETESRLEVVRGWQAGESELLSMVAEFLFDMIEKF